MMFRQISALRLFAVLLTVAIAALSLGPELEAQANTSGMSGQASGDEASNDPKRPITPEDYGKWERLGFGQLSPNGEWLAVSISRVNEENELRIHRVDSDSTIVVPFGSGARFTEDGLWLAYLIGVSPDERERLQKQNEQARNKLVIVDLSSGESEEIEDIASFSFGDEGRFLAMRGYRAQGRESAGVDLVLRNLADGTDTSFGNVAQYSWQDEGPLLALLIDAEGQAGNGLQLVDPTSGTFRTLESDRAKYSNLTWREKSADLAVLKVQVDEAYVDSTNVVLAWRDLDGAAADPLVFDHAEPEGFPADHRVVNFAGLRWSEGGDRLFFGIKEREKKEAEEDEAEGEEEEEEAEPEARPGRRGGPGSVGGRGGGDDDTPGVEIWHSRDVDVIPTQKRQANRDRRDNYLSVWHLDTGQFVQLEDELVESLRFTDNTDVMTGTDQTPYELDRMFGPVYQDVYSVDVTDGSRERVVEKVQFNLGVSPGGMYHLYFKDDHYWTHNLQTGEDVSITAEVPATFTNVDDDHTVLQKPPHGTAGWLEDDEAILINDKYDVWMVYPDGRGGERLTDGAGEQVRHRRMNLESNLDAIDPDEPIYLSLYGERTKKWGYGRVEIGESPERLVYLDKNVGRLTKAENAEVFAYSVQGFDDSPDYFVGDAEFDRARQVTATNPFHDDYLWGHSELIDYENTWGKALQGALYYPADYEPGRQYPMIVYYYEIVSNTLHTYPVPSERSAYNPAVWTSEGYFVYRPDIVYRDRNPGLSAKEALEPAVQAVIETGLVDPDKIGLVGHSWGGYQTTFMSTVSDMFAANVAGAPLTNLVSMYLSMYWNSGGTDARIFEISQGRMEVPPWEDMASYVANSPMHNIETMNTPLLVAFGTEDGAVEYNQGVEFYNAARRAGKDLVLLVYEGENHSLAKEPNQLDYHRRIKEWFAYYLKGEPAPAWITEGMSFLDQEKALKNGGR